MVLFQHTARLLSVMTASRDATAPITPYITPKQPLPAGTALTSNPPVLFQPLRIRDVVFQNRIWVAPMCTFSADNGHLTDFHFQHLSAFAFRGASLTIIEATAVSPSGRISPEDSGLWKDSQIAPLRRLADFVHSQGQKLGIQLTHAGRKASVLAPWLVPSRGGSRIATEDLGGWPHDVRAPSPIRWGEGYHLPQEMSKADIHNVIGEFCDAARRAVMAGIDVIELHGAHGYLLNQWLSPSSNMRVDEYGGCFENRVRLVMEVIAAVRGVIPSGMPLFFRISATEWLEGLAPAWWTVHDTIRFAKLLPGIGVDLLDVSSGGNNAAQKIATGNEYQVGIAGQVRRALRAENIPLLVGAVGWITEALQAEEIVRGTEGESTGPKADVVLIGRQFLREPEWVLRAAYSMGVEIQWPIQYQRAKFRPK